MTTSLDQLKRYTSVVADTGDIDSIATYAAQDATTNPSLLLKAALMPQYQALVNDAVQWGKAQSATHWVEPAMDKLAVNFGVEILGLIPGRISTEVDAHLSFDTQATIAKARHLMQLYRQCGVGCERILIKIAATWEGIQAAQQLEHEGIHCNLTLLFSFAQAIACAQAGVYLISPFVGRILDWHQAQGQHIEDTATQDPGVQAVRRIYQYYKKHHYPTLVMGASFRNTAQIMALAGCDKLTISPALLYELQQMHNPITPQLTQALADASEEPRCSLSHAQFQWQHCQDAMATEKLAQGLRSFDQDYQRLKQHLIDSMS